MPVYITPYYNSSGLQIGVGEFSKGLAGTDVPSLQKTLSAMKAKWSELCPEAMYVAAIRLYDLGLKDESVYWFYSAQYRAKLFQGLLEPASIGGIGSKAFELKQAYNAFFQLTGTYINGYAFGDPQKLARTVGTVQAEGKTLPSLKKMYPDIAFVEEGKWPAVNETINSGMTDFIEYLTKNVDTIKKQRQEAGVEGKY